MSSCISLLGSFTVIEVHNWFSVERAKFKPQVLLETVYQVGNNNSVFSLKNKINGGVIVLPYTLIQDDIVWRCISCFCFRLGKRIYTIGIKLSIFWTFGTNFLTHLNELTYFISSEQKNILTLASYEFIETYPYCPFVKCIICPKTDRVLMDRKLVFIKAVSTAAFFA